jgi:hypothetical protein
MDKDLEDSPNPYTFGDQEFHQAQEFPREHHKTQRPEADTERRKEFDEDITI